MLPFGHLRDLPAISKWFLPTEPQDGPFQLDTSYLEQFGSANVPLELSSAEKSKNQRADILFQRSEAPLSIFLRWAQSANPQTQPRLYLAQASLAKFPAQMERDLPTPQIVLDAGRGDIYDTNLWLGVAPTYTPLHRDPNPNLFVQLAGQKIVRILPPAAGREVFMAVQNALGRDASAAFRGEEMMEGEEERLLGGQIWGDRPANDNPAFFGSEATLNGGDGLFIPKGFWHSIRGIGTGITGSVNWWFR